jgi:hypothetical protein
MITSIFSKSKPINSIIVIAFTVMVFVVAYFQELFLSFDSFLSTLINLIIVVFLILLLGFINTKNKLVSTNDYTLMTFGLLILMFPETMGNKDLLLANLFVLLSLRRLISLQSNLYVKKKLFDAGFWIAVATLFYFWAILFFALVLVALIYHSQNNIKNVIAPFVGVAALFIMLIAYNLLLFDEFIRNSNFQRYASLDFTPYNIKGVILKLTVLLSAFVWTLIYLFKSLQDKNKKFRPSYFLLAWACVLGLLLAIIAPVKNGSEFIFLFAPFAIIMANYIENITESWFREVFVALFVITPLIGSLL